MPDTMKSDIMKTALDDLISGDMPAPATIREIFNQIMDGDVSPVRISAFLIALKMRGERVEDIAAAASVMREKALTIDAPDGTMDIVGTGGDGIGTYNISTATAFVVAGCGVPVAKHGNKAVSSKSGAADVLSCLNIKLDCDMSLVSHALHTANVCFLMAPRHHAAMRHVGPVRAELVTRTIFNLLGPLANPALVKRIMIGVFDKAWCTPFAHALAQLGTTHAWVVHGSDGLDEVTTTGVTHVTALENGAVREFTISPDDFGIATASLDDLRGGNPEENADHLRALLDGATGAYRDIVIMNAAVAIVAGGHETDLATGAKRARHSLDTGQAKNALDELVRITNSGA
jgi:anthranilate phosphoribosyltransferase